MFSSNTGGAAKGLGGLAKATYGLLRSYGKSKIHKAGMKGITHDLLGVGGGITAKLLGGGFLLYDAFTGYQEGGIWGASKNVASSAAMMYGFRAAFPLIGIAAKIAAPAALVAGGAFAMNAASQGISPLQMAARPFTNEYLRKRAKLEMGSPIQDPYGTVSTMRKRSLMAMRESKITARGALGMEAHRRYIPYMR
jgi:hypothetical protein